MARSGTRTPRLFLLTPVGSAGDVHPFIGIGRELRYRGHEVTLLAGEAFRAAAEDAGLDFVATWTAEEFQALTERPGLWHPRRGLELVLGAVAEGLRSTYAALTRLHRPGRTVLVGHTLSLATRTFTEKHQVPAATLHLAPSLLRSVHLTPAIPPGRDISWLPHPIRRALFWAVDRWLVDPHIVPELNRWRRELDLPPVRRPFDEWLHAPDLTVGLFPDWFAPPQPDWPPQVRLTGFPLFDAGEDAPLEPRLQEFLAAGQPPLVLTPGSANRQASGFFDAGIQAVTSLGRRAIVLTRYPDQLPTPLPDSLLHVDWASLARLLPRCSALLHHGGIGTSARGLAAGIPQLVMPMGFDQPDNAVRLRRLNVGELIAPNRFTPRHVEETLRRLLSSPATAAACRRYRDAIGGTSGIGATCDLLESLG
ncbi:MAG: glycosyltransferase family 1 protein [Gemmatimonadetes bacterium]|uniref:Glycosyltransferase family 1 protein n=1 Tax=Candidatus Kutchimonas denitrificans TaxID=3056748 RepID=A0AAE4Z4V2_9BACT|nr:glycosyltransferase family 1 protein [Gemmatimonadota bacterium]NIR73805.1 glycosyltransferase family 1 protein [Candidatus Kutchimonas denitrificans]NIS00078.1 glycosyltransferase family 1 protein [Gemmatimonadota bacterium]NIT65667.1 glycosyltransferase family 1 protein [Gemmatimonadota bacterium]NIU53115.1 glycosyltransferase [Gemmatimonadota bacterium]